ncbi:hypothetical protein [Paenibacillus methanolicus]|uniref:hypothetical protein n=1 Tax=Paenibacillus methanolicus TaxID=582686 RepID=UPI0011E7F522|nr:hypothetical protein [Paenibacillus methanolicus]
MRKGTEKANQRTGEPETEGYRPERLPKTLRLIKRKSVEEIPFRFDGGDWSPGAVVARGGFRAIGIRWEGTFANRSARTRRCPKTRTPSRWKRRTTSTTAKTRPAPLKQ